MTETSTLGKRQAHPAVAFRLDDADRARLGDAEVGPADGHRHAQELLAQVRPGRGGQRSRLVGQSGGVARAGGGNSSRISDAVLVNGRHEDVRRSLAGELDDQLGQVGLDGLDADLCQRLVQADLVGGQRLDLDHLLRPVRP